MFYAEQVTPSLQLLNPDAPAGKTLIVLHGNAQRPADIEPYYADLTTQGWRVALACSGQPGQDNDFIWTDFEATDAALQKWADEAGGQPYWAGFSVSAYFLMRGALQGQVPAAGILGVTPSILRHPSLWPAVREGRSLPIPCALLAGKTDPYYIPESLHEFASELSAEGVPVRVWDSEDGHEHPHNWPEVRGEMLTWLLAGQQS